MVHRWTESLSHLLDFDIEIWPRGSIEKKQDLDTHTEEDAENQIPQQRTEEGNEARDQVNL